MSPIKFEENIKEALESRTITVSEGAWTTLENRLEVTKNPKKRSFWWMGIAASVLLAGWISFETSSSTKLNTPKVVVEPEVKETVPIREIESTSPIIVQSDTEYDVEFHQASVVEYTVITRTESKPILIEVDTAPKEVVEVSTFQEQKVKEIIAHVMETTQQKNEVSDQEIEALIVKAQKEIYARKMMDTSVKTVSAENLLFEIEFENDKSFRDKVFDELKNQFKSMKNAVAQRENK